MPNLKASQKRAEIDLMLKLSFLSYAGCYNPWGAGVERAVKRWVKRVTPTQSVAWGPVAHGNLLDLFTTTLAYIVKDEELAADGDAVYTLVIRGTNALSWSTVVFQDLAVNDMTPWKLISPTAELTPGSDPSISEGAARTLRDLNRLKSGGKTIVDFLADKVANEDATIRVTGHSLGGMAAMMYPVWLMDQFKARGLDIHERFRVWPVAGLTPGNADFARYTETLFADHGNQYLRIVNELDFATKAWVQTTLGTEVPTMYLPQSPMNDADKAIIQQFYNIALNRNYTHPRAFTVVPSQLASISSWFFQFIYQHTVPYVEFLSEPEPRAALLRMLDLETAKRNPIGALRLHWAIGGRKPEPTTAKIVSEPAAETTAEA